MNVTPRKAGILFCFILFSSWSFAQPLPPDRITNPPGLQFFMGAAYNSEDDEYFLTYAADGAPRGLRLTTDGVVLLPEIAVGPAANGVTTIAYNPNRNEYLYVYRGTTVWGQYLAADGTLIGPAFVIGSGGPPRVAYSTVSDRYVIVFQKLSVSPSQVRSVTVDGDSTTATPVLGSGVIATNAHSPAIAYGSISNKFLVVFSKEASPPTRANVQGRLINGTGFGASAAFTIAGGSDNQQLPEVAAGPSPTPGRDRFLVQFEDWVRVSSHSADVAAHYVDSNGAVSTRFRIYETPGKNSGWDVPGPVVYNESTGKFVSTSFFAVNTFAREVDAATQALGPVTIVAKNPSFPLAAAPRPDPADPQVLVLTRTKNGGDGVHAHIFHLSSSREA